MSKLQTIKLSDMFTLQMGKTPSRDNPAYWNGTHKWVSIADLGKATKFIVDTKECITDLAVSETGIRATPKDTVVMSFKLSIGKTAVTAEEIYTNEAIMSFVDKGIYDFDIDYIYHLFSGKDWSEGTNKAVMGVTLNKATLSQISIPLPPIEEQRKIAHNLEKVTYLIEVCNTILEKLDLLVKSRFVEMFGEPISNSMGWDCCELGDCLESIDNGKSYVCDNDCRTGDNPAILKLSAVTYGIYKPDENKAMIDEDLFDESAEVKDNDLLFTRKNTPELVGMSAYVFSTPPKLMMPDLIFRLNAKTSCNKIYLWQLINHDLFRPCIQNIANGSAKSMSNISKERLSKLTIPVPPLALQEQFAAFVEQTDKSKLAVKQVLEKAETLKKALMQEYFG